MKTVTKLLAIIFSISSLSITYGQETSNNQIGKSKSNVKNNKTDSEQKGWDGTVKGGNIHIDSDNNGTEIIAIPTSPKPTILILNAEGTAFEVDNAKNLTSGMASGREATSGMATGKRMHKPFVITKEIDKKNDEKGIQENGFSNKGINQAGMGNRKADENGNIDISMLESGNYKACYGKACFIFTFDAVEGKVKGKVLAGNSGE